MDLCPFNNNFCLNMLNAIFIKLQKNDSDYIFAVSHSPSQSLLQLCTLFPQIRLFAPKKYLFIFRLPQHFQDPKSLPQRNAWSFCLYIFADKLYKPLILNYKRYIILIDKSTFIIVYCTIIILLHNQQQNMIQTTFINMIFL